MTDWNERERPRRFALEVREGQRITVTGEGEPLLVTEAKPDEPRWLTLNESARYARMRKTTLRSAVDCSDVVARRQGNRIMILRESIDAWLLHHQKSDSRDPKDQPEQEVEGATPEQ